MYKRQLNALETQVNGFLDQPSAATLESTKPAFKAAYLTYENTSAAYFGPAGALSVSYTHLDVYKRQWYTRMATPNAG